MKIIAGMHAEYDGRRCGSTGGTVHFRSPREALAAGIGMVHQELSVVPELTVAENVYLGVQPTKRLGLIDWRAMRARRARASRAASASTSIRATPMRLAADRPAAAGRAGARAVLGRAHRHPRRADLGALAARGRSACSSVLRRLRDSGRSLVFISHFLDDVLAISRPRHGVPQRPARRHRAGAARSTRAG